MFLYLSFLSEELDRSVIIVFSNFSNSYFTFIIQVNHICLFFEVRRRYLLTLIIILYKYTYKPEIKCSMLMKLNAILNGSGRCESIVCLFKFLLNEQLDHLIVNTP